MRIGAFDSERFHEFEEPSLSSEDRADPDVYCSACGAVALEQLEGEDRPASAAPSTVAGAARVLLVGDSHTFGAFGAELERLLRATGAHVVRSSKIGTAVKYWLPRLPELLRAERPTQVIVALGANMRGYPSARGTSAQIRSLVALVRKEQPRAGIVWIGPPRMRSDTEATLQRFNTIIKNGLPGGVRFIDSARYTPRYEGRDGTHYPPTPSKSWARGVFKELSSGAPAVPSAPAPTRAVPTAPLPTAPARPTASPPPVAPGAPPWRAPATPPADPSAYRQFRLTNYYVIAEADRPKKDIAVPIYDAHGAKLAEVSPEFFAGLSLEGTGKLLDGRMLNVSSKWLKVDPDLFAPVWAYHRGNRGLAKRSPGYSGLQVKDGRVTAAMTFYEIPKSRLGNGYGTQRKIPYTPFRTLAADIGKKANSEQAFKNQGGLVPPGTRVFIREFVGFRLPDGTVHDGWFVVNDTGGGIFGAHFDVFVGTRQLGKTVKPWPSVGHVWFPGIERRIAPSYVYGLHDK